MRIERMGVAATGRLFGDAVTESYGETFGAAVEAARSRVGNGYVRRKARGVLANNSRTRGVAFRACHAESEFAALKRAK